MLSLHPRVSLWRRSYVTTAPLPRRCDHRGLITAEARRRGPQFTAELLGEASIVDVLFPLLKLGFAMAPTSVGTVGQVPCSHGI